MSSWLFPDLPPAPSPRALPVLGAQSDITYHATRAKSVLNGPDTTGMGYWSINPYVGCAFGCAYCYARYAHRYVMERVAAAPEADPALKDELRAMPPWLAFERHVVVKENAADSLRRALRHGSAKHLGLLDGQAIVIGTATDPYQPAERRYRVTRGVLEVLAEHPGLDVVIITKSPLITRDVDLLRRLARHSDVSVHVSLITLDRELARRIEPRAPTPESRLRAMARLREAEVDVCVNVMPVLPGITDEPAALEALVRGVAAAGVRRLGLDTLRLQHEARKRYLPFIEQEFPHLARRYHNTYARSHDVGERYRTKLRAFVDRLCATHGLTRTRYEDGDEEESLGAPADLQLQLEL